MKYGRRVAEGLDKTIGAMDKGSIGATASWGSVVHAEQESKESKPD